jgi:hypothetical protein
MYKIYWRGGVLRWATFRRRAMTHILIHIRGSIALHNKVRDPPLVCKINAFRVYSLAQTYGLRQEVIQVARLT